MSHQNMIHKVADSLLEYFEGEGAVNYIEQTLGCNDDPSKSFVLTMQKVEGLTPCQKLAEAEKRIEQIENDRTHLTKENDRLHSELDNLQERINRYERSEVHLNDAIAALRDGE